jgi:hypothetical protein
MAVGAIGLIVAYGMTWTATVVPLIEGTDDAVREESVSGRDLYPLAGAAGWLALAAVGGIVATKRWGRVLVAVVALVAGAGGALGGLATATDEARSGVGWLIALMAGALVSGAAAAVVVRGRTWPTLGSQYERRSSGAARMSAWDAQDSGRDPTDDLVE